MKKRGYLALACWGAATAVWIGFCLFLTWQTGEGTGELSLLVTRWLLKALALVGIRPEEARFHASLRLFAHFGVFFVAGALFCGTAETFARVVRGGGWMRFVAGALVTAMALFADVPKIWIPGRHLTWSESALNAAGALAGYLATALVFEIIHIKKERRPQKM